MRHDIIAKRPKRSATSVSAGLWWGRSLVLLGLCFSLVLSLMAPLTAGSVVAKDRADRQRVSAEAIIPSPGPSSSARQWRIETANGASLTSGQPFALYNTRYGNYVRYGSRWFGINLVWSSTPSRTFTVTRKAGSGPVKYGELVALRSTSGGGYIRYGSRDWGINLVWSSTPVYEWQIQGGTTGTTVANRAVVTLNNIIAPRPSFPPWCGKPGAAPVYGWRPFGINLVWNPPGFYIPSLSIPGVPNWAESWLLRLASLGAQYLGIPVEQYKATVKTLCALSRNDAGRGAGDRNGRYVEDAGLDRADQAMLRKAAEDKRKAGDEVKQSAANGHDKGNGRDGAQRDATSRGHGKKHRQR